MDKQPKWKHSLDYYALKAIRLERELADAKFDVERLNEVVEILNNKKRKKFSGYFVTFMETNGAYHSPLIVEADSPEEALIPEGSEEARGDFCHRLYDKNEYDEI